VLPPVEVGEAEFAVAVKVGDVGVLVAAGVVGRFLFLLREAPPELEFGAQSPILDEGGEVNPVPAAGGRLTVAVRFVFDAQSPPQAPQDGAGRSRR
jgi:hypothetical protein